jgi:hypothetical protein
MPLIFPTLFKIAQTEAASESAAVKPEDKEAESEPVEDKSKLEEVKPAAATLATETKSESEDSESESRASKRKFTGAGKGVGRADSEEEGKGESEEEDEGEDEDEDEDSVASTVSESKSKILKWSELTNKQILEVFSGVDKITSADERQSERILAGKIKTILKERNISTAGAYSKKICDFLSWKSNPDQFAESKQRRKEGAPGPRKKAKLESKSDVSSLVTNLSPSLFSSELLSRFFSFSAFSHTRFFSLHSPFSGWRTERFFLWCPSVSEPGHAYRHSF